MNLVLIINSRMLQWNGWLLLCTPEVLGSNLSLETL